jgi:SSS family solute:Na+ symporter
LLACLVVPFIGGLIWRRGTTAAAMAAIGVGLVVRLVLFVLTPTIYGVDNTILYIPNTLVTAAFDGWPTFIAFAASIITYVIVSLLTPPALLRGLDIQVAKDVDDALDVVGDGTEPAVAALVKTEAR